MNKNIFITIFFRNFFVSPIIFTNNCVPDLNFCLNISYLELYVCIVGMKIIIFPRYYSLEKRKNLIKAKNRNISKNIESRRKFVDKMTAENIHEEKPCIITGGCKNNKVFYREFSLYDILMRIFEIQTVFSHEPFFLVEDVQFFFQKVIKLINKLHFHLEQIS